MLLVVLASLAAILFIAVLGCIALGGIYLFKEMRSDNERARNDFMLELERIRQSAAADAAEQREAYEHFMEIQEQREQIIAEADKEWVTSDESRVDYDDDLNWEGGTDA